MRHRILRHSTAMALMTISALGAACTVHQTEAPPVSGPSTFAQAVNVTVTPDRITLDGSSQSAVTIQVNGPDGKPVSGIALRLDMSVEGQIQDCGTLSARTVVTDNNGVARATYTAPAGYCVPTTSPFQTVTIRAVPFGTNAETANASIASIRLVPPGVILPPADTPTPLFTITPQPINFNIPATFDASSSCPGPAQAGSCLPSSGSSSITSYNWNFGDSGTASGRVVTHTYVNSTSPTTSFNVTLTVTNDRGITASTQQVVSVSASPAPSGDWTNSPVNPNVGDNIIFNADGVHAAAGHTIVQYSWNFGDNSPAGTAFIVNHTYTQANTYAVTLSVRDDANQKAVLTHNLVVGTGAPLVIVNPPSVSTHVNLAFTLDASATQTFGGATIQSITWTASGATNASGSGPTFTTSYSTAAGSPYTIIVTVTDTLGRTGRATVTVTVS